MTPQVHLKTLFKFLITDNSKLFGSFSGFGYRQNIAYTIRYDTIGEFNVDSKAEYSA